MMTRNMWPENFQMNDLSSHFGLLDRLEYDFSGILDSWEERRILGKMMWNFKYSGYDFPRIPNDIRLSRRGDSRRIDRYWVFDTIMKKTVPVIKNKIYRLILFYLKVCHLLVIHAFACSDFLLFPSWNVDVFNGKYILKLHEAEKPCHRPRTSHLLQCLQQYSLCLNWHFL